MSDPFGNVYGLNGGVYGQVFQTNANSNANTTMGNPFGTVFGVTSNPFGSVYGGANIVMIITSPATATATIGQPFTYQITTDEDGTANAPTNYVATGLPTGLTINPDTGLISGTPQ